MVGEGGGVVVFLVTPPQPESARNTRNDRLSKVLRLMACPHRGAGRFEKDEVILWRWRVEVFGKAEALFAFGNVPKGVGGMEEGMDGRVAPWLSLDVYQGSRWERLPFRCDQGWTSG